MMHPIFGKRPSGKRLEMIQQSPNYREGKFQNQHHTPQIAENYSYPKAIYEFFFKKSPDLRPTQPIPTVAIDWEQIAAMQAKSQQTLGADNLLLWLGHSTYYMQIDGKRILVDPVLSGSVSPLPGGGKSFKGTDICRVEDLPAIDFLLITHDHYDHLDYETIKALQPRVGRVICGLGVGEHLEYWGYSPEQIIERDWNETVDLGQGFIVHTAAARHFSGRSIWTSNTLWMSYVLQTPTQKLYLGGDSGYDTHFAEIGAKHGPFDLAILENGQYNLAWKYIHMQPEEVWKAAEDLQAKVLLPVHSSKFALANHAWYEPLTRLVQSQHQRSIDLLTPQIGQLIYLQRENAPNQQWWKQP
ncbi:MBL fold metallo-hydrolase [Flavobacterium sp. JP2137]|uniref:MBL fold metallo-hydrolase n=1 Tax=Flavobacterium sp. JP2137 TaxID=3414510 RepID=UPI003D2FD04F